MPPLTPEEREEALAFVRATIAARLHEAPEPPPPRGGPFAEPAACFVTLRVRETGDLRGCIGQTEARSPLGESLADSAVASATRDPRFPAVAPSELEDLAIEISVLGPMEPVRRPDEIEVGRHGLYLRHGWRAGLLLPQVAEDQGWTAEEFFAHVCAKAELPPTAWQDPAARVWRFTADVFHES